MRRSNPRCNGPCNEDPRLLMRERPRQFVFDDEENRYGIRNTVENYYTWVREMTDYCTWHFRDHYFIQEPRTGIYPDCMEYISDSFAPLGWGLKCGRMSLNT